MTRTPVVRALGGLLGLLTGAAMVLVAAPPAAAAVDTSAYIARVAPLAQRESSQFGVPASVSIAQSILESGWGRSSLSTQSNAYFGIKCTQTTPPTWTGPYADGCVSKDSLEYDPNGDSSMVTSWFRRYPSVANSFLDHGFFLTSRPRYAAAFGYRDYPDQFIREVAKAGYATDPAYADRVIDIMRRYNLYRFDPSYDQDPTVADAGGFVAMSPLRVLDTRFTRRVGAGETITLQLGGRVGIPADAAAVALNVTATDTLWDGFVTAWPAGAAQPPSSNLNQRPGTIVPNHAVVALGAGGSISIKASSPTQLIVDVMGFYRAAGATPTPGSVLPLTPARLADTRTTVALAPGADLTVPVAGRAGVPASGVSAALVNVTATDTTAAGWLVAYPGGALPTASNVNFVAHQTVGNAAWATLGPDGQVRIRNGSPGTVHVVVDVYAYAVGGEVTMRGGFVPVTPRRLLDTRPTGVAKWTTYGLDVSATPAAAVALNVTVTEPGAPGFVAVHPSDRPLPVASILNFVAGQTVPNLTQVRVGADGRVAVANRSDARSQLVIDLAGYYTR